MNYYEYHIIEDDKDNTGFSNYIMTDQIIYDLDDMRKYLKKNCLECNNLDFITKLTKTQYYHLVKEILEK